MDLNHLLACLLLLFLGASHATTDEAPSTPLFSSPSPLPTTWSSTPQTSPESTQGPTSDATDVTSSPKPSLTQQDQDHKEPSVSSPQTEKPRLPQEKMEAAPFKFPEVDIEESGGSQQWETAAQGVAIMLMKPKGQPSSGEAHTAASHAMGLFLAGCGLLLCLFIGVYCAYSRGSKKEPFSHHRLYEDGFDDPALFLDSPKDYDWFFYETDGYVYPTASQAQTQPIQTLSIPALKQPPPTLDGSPGKLSSSEVGQDSKQPQASPVKLECLSPANLRTGNFI
ncbi:Golgi-associated olfactory signaling regulator [Podarcis raffonei]|uniref:Golgi-associated olfactory signaling regulator n=1 Tax=Podarcis raffonei TaxID=65483 RepID=UPI00232996C0|nr:Golgi-associated olfactory signaling regulator [Podarcis raffonei]XP_053217414.1 Golgi-associated olfactory signaling regulator [Podarcis raffonei]